MAVTDLKPEALLNLSDSCEALFCGLACILQGVTHLQARGEPVLTRLIPAIYVGLIEITLWLCF